MTDREYLLEMLRDRSFRRGEFELASGGTSDHFIDVEMTSMFATGAYLIGEVVYRTTCDLDFFAIGGMQAGSIPLTTATVARYYQHGRPTAEGFWVREEVKDHGTRRRVEGNLKPDSHVVVIDDVFTTGRSTMKAVDAVRDHGCEVVCVLALVDRLQGAEALFRAHGISDVRSVFTIRDFGVEG